MIGQQFGIQTGFNMPIQKPANKFPGFSEKQIQQLYKDTANIPIEKRAEVQYQLYKEILPQIKTNELKDKRIEVKANIYNDSLEERDVLKKNISQAQLRMEDLADQVKDKFNLIPTAPTNEVLDGFSKLLADKRIDPKLVEDYMNGKSEEILYVSGLKDRPMTLGDTEGRNPLLRAGGALLQGVAGTIKGAYEGLVPGFGEMAADIRKITRDQTKSLPEKFNQILFGEIGMDYIGGAIGDTFGGALEGLYKGFATESERKLVNEKVKGIMEGIVKKEPVQNIMKKYNKLNPQEQQELNDLIGYAGNALEFVGIGLGAKPAVQGAKAAGKVGIETLEKTTGKAVTKLGAIKIGKEATIEDANMLVGKIIQGDTLDIAPALETLKSIDTKGIKTYKDLSEVLDSRGKNYMDLVDKRLEQETKIFKPQDTKTVTTVGNTTVEQQPIVKGISQLEELYSSIDDPTNLARIKELQTKFDTNGLTLKEMNDIAREYNSVFKNKAFSKTGDPLTSVNAQAYENNRKAMKEFVRNQMPDDTTKKLDIQYANLSNTKRLVDKMTEKVNTLSQKINKRGMVEKVTRAIGRGIDIATFGGVRGLLTSFLPSNIGNKVLNSIDLEDALNVTLKKLDSVIKKVDNGTLKESDIKSLIPKKIDGTSNINISSPSIQQPKTIKTQSETIPQLKAMVKAPETITVYRGTNGGVGQGEALRGKGTYYSNSKDVAKYYGKDVVEQKINIRDVFDGNKPLGNIQKEIINNLPDNMKKYLSEDMKYTYNSLIKEIEGNTGLDGEQIAEVINSQLKNKGYKGVKYNIGQVSETLQDKGLGNNDGYIFREEANKKGLKTSNTSITQPKAVMKAPEEPLIAEARKYKSAEEFVASQGEVVYHGTPYKFDEFKGDVGFFTKKKQFAEDYGSQKSFESEMDADVTVYERILPKKYKLFNPQNPEHIQKIINEIPEEIQVGGTRGGARITKKEWIDRIQGIFEHDTPEFVKKAAKEGQYFEDMSLANHGTYRIQKIGDSYVDAVKVRKGGDVVEILGYTKLKDFKDQYGQLNTQKLKEYAQSKGYDVDYRGGDWVIVKDKEYGTVRFDKKDTYIEKGDPFWGDFEGDEVFLKAIKKSGFDGWIASEKGVETIGVLNPKSLSKIDKLKQIREEANKKLPKQKK